MLARFHGITPPDCLPLADLPFVIDAGGRMSGLLDGTTASPLGVLRSRASGVDGTRLTEPPDDLDAIVARVQGRPLLLAVCDAHRRPWQQDLIDGVLARRPDTLVIGTGTTHDAVLADGNYVGTRGSGRANLEAAADLLLGGA